MMLAFGFALHQVEDRLEVDLALAERAVADEVLPAAEILEVHVHGDRKEVLDHFRGVGAAFLQLADVGRELEIPGVHASMIA